MDGVAGTRLREALKAGKRSLDPGGLPESGAKAAHVKKDCVGLDVSEEVLKRGPGPKAAALGILEAPKNAASVAKLENFQSGLGGPQAQLKMMIL